jgi:Fur family ferric uptake transcriptional regulator
MTVAPDVRRLPFQDLEGAVAALREQGLRLSTSRRLILQALFAASQPLPAEAIARTLDLELTSVYRNLETLERHGLVQHVHLGHGAGLYALVGEGEREYLYCERCRAVRALDPVELAPVKAQIEERFGFQTRFTHFALVGVCPECAATTSTVRCGGPGVSGRRGPRESGPRGPGE